MRSYNFRRARDRSRDASAFYKIRHPRKAGENTRCRHFIYFSRHKTKPFEEARLIAGWTSRTRLRLQNRNEIQ